jgi:prevent-host-death family protein
MMDRLHLRRPRGLLRAGKNDFPFLRNVEKAEAGAALADYVEAARGGPVVITVRGRPVAFLARVTKIDLEDLSMSTDPDFIALLRRSRARYRAGGGIPLEEIEREFGVRPGPARGGTIRARGGSRRASRVR